MSKAPFVPNQALSSLSHSNSQHRRNAKTLSSGMEVNFSPTNNKRAKHSDYIKNSLFFFEFEKKNDYNNFFVHNNPSRVIMKQIIDGLLKLPRTYMLSNHKSLSNVANTSFSTRKKTKNTTNNMD